MTAADGGPDHPTPFASKRRAAAYVVLAVLTSAIFPLFVWVSTSDVVVPEPTFVAV